MAKQEKEDIISVLAAAYKVPGEYFIASLVLFAVWKVMKEWNPYAWIALLFGIIFLALEVITPVAAGYRIINKIINYFSK